MRVNECFIVVRHKVTCWRRSRYDRYRQRSCRVILLLQLDASCSEDVVEDWEKGVDAAFDKDDFCFQVAPKWLVIVVHDSEGEIIAGENGLMKLLVPNTAERHLKGLSLRFLLVLFTNEKHHSTVTIKRRSEWGAKAKCGASLEALKRHSPQVGDEQAAFDSTDLPTGIRKGELGLVARQDESFALEWQWELSVGAVG